ncbi:hypothetical protein Y032_0014g2393 [Ancylostoma ceylanicum]|uniref:Uncharacterized protein n=1 Tax=Ancylostoma ceylanicum TaxID=53326 RepID=A0A016VAD9_9BILA|nr:hypothetical protein Y032_0014g2393 [Ancylostoma ceylanicum]
MAMVLSYHYDILYGSREVFSPSSQHHHIALRIFRMSFINKACETSIFRAKVSSGRDCGSYPCLVNE